MFNLHKFQAAIIVVLFLNLIPGIGKSQVNSLPYLKVGDTIPEVELKILNYYKENSKISDFRGKLLILDFWSVNCGYCIDILPQLAKLQKKLDGKAEIIGIGMDTSPNVISDFMKKREKSGKKIELPTAILPVVHPFMKRFKIQSMPYDVWIDENGVIIHITDDLPVTEENIMRIAKGEKLKLVPKRMLRRLYSNEAFLIRGIVGDSKNIIRGSVLSPYIDSLAQSWPFDSQVDTSFTRLLVVNQAINQIYKNAYGIKNKWLHESDFQRVIVKSTNDITRMGWEMISAKRPSSEEYDYFLRKGLFNYELVLPKEISVSEASLIMIKDLDLAFNCKSEIVDTLMEHYELVKLPEGRNNKKQNSSNREEMYMLNNTDVSNLLFHICNNTKQIVVNKTGLETITIGLPTDKSNICKPLRSIEEYKQVLIKFGYDLIKVEKKLPVLMIIDLKNMP